jgi:GNAT superfamily N-acetyltransferase
MTHREDRGAAAVRVVGYASLPHPDHFASALDRIFFEASLTRSFDTEATRSAFRERWLGRYLVHDPEHAFLALDASGELVGYLVGCLEDPVTAPRFADIPYFPALAALTAVYPAHLHINVASDLRGQGIGRALIEAFAAHAAEAGINGMHVVTGAGQRNVHFYERAAFVEKARFASNGRDLVLLGRLLGR